MSYTLENRKHSYDVCRDLLKKSNVTPKLKKISQIKKRNIINTNGVILNSEFNIMNMIGERVMGCMEELIRHATILVNIKATKNVTLPAMSKELQNAFKQLYKCLDLHKFVYPSQTTPDDKKYIHNEDSQEVPLEENLKDFLQITTFFKKFVGSWATSEVIELFDFVDNLEEMKQENEWPEDVDEFIDTAQPVNRCYNRSCFDNLVHFNMKSLDNLIQTRCKDDRQSYLSNPSKTSFAVLDAMRSNLGLSKDYLYSFVKHFLRILKTNPQVEQTVLKSPTNYRYSKEFIDELGNLKNVCEHELNMDCIEDFARKMYIQYSSNRRLNYDILKELLETEKKNIIQENTKIIKNLEETIRNHKLEVDMAHKLFNETLSRIREQLRSQMEIYETDADETIVRRENILALTKQREQLCNDNWHREAELFQQKNKLGNEISEVMKQFDDVAYDLHLEITNKMKQYELRRSIMWHMEERYYPLAGIFKKLQMEVLTKLNREECLIFDEIIRNTAAIKIQNWWRNYRVRNWTKIKQKMKKNKNKKKAKRRKVDV